MRIHLANKEWKKNTIYSILLLLFVVIVCKPAAKKTAYNRVNTNIANNRPQVAECVCMPFRAY